MKMHPSHRPCLFALAALPARSRTIDLRGNVTHTGNLGSVPSRWLGGSVVRWLGSCANPQPETRTSRPENEGHVPKAPILKYRIILRGQANIMQIACAVTGSVPKFFKHYYERERMNPGDNPPIGIVLGSDRDEAVIRYTLNEHERNLFAVKYHLNLPTEEELRRELQRERAAFEEARLLAAPQKVAKVRIRGDAK